MFDLVVIGGGAAGFFGAIQVAERHPSFRILIVEKSSKLLSKVRVSGGGRCNVTHACFEPIALSHHYPRGEKQLKSLFKIYQSNDVVEWFQRQGVKLKAEADGRMFPVTDSSQTIIDCFLGCAKRYGIKIETGNAVLEIIAHENRHEIRCDRGIAFSRNILIASGGHPQIHAYSFIGQLGHTIVPPIPSLFTFNDFDKQFKNLMGISVPRATIRIAGTKLIQQGPLLITHWGLSGHAVIKLSAWAAQYLFEQKYDVQVLVSWIGEIREEAVRIYLIDYRAKYPKRKVKSYPLYELPQRLWSRLCDLAEVDESKIWDELPHRNQNRLMELLIRCPFHIKGKTTFKEEFVTCGGVDLKDVNLETMESRKVKRVYFAGEVLNIDGETGGFNFQSAWTTAFIAAKNIL